MLQMSRRHTLAFWLTRHLPLLLACLATCAFAICILATNEARPMHHDEANQAYSARRLLDFHGYAFKPEDHHGPTLYYALLPISWLRGVFSGSQLDIATVRLVPLLAAVVAMLLPFLPGKRLGRGSALLTALLLALSPCFAFYSSYFVQEMLLTAFVALTLFALWRWLDHGEQHWALIAGCAIGLCLATKETWVLSAAATFLAASATALLHPRQTRQLWQQRRPLWRHLVAALCAMLVVCLIFFSSFGAHPQGIADFFRCWLHYADKGTSTSTPFAAPFLTYARWLFCFQAGSHSQTPRWSEWLILAGYALAFLQLFLPRLRPHGLTSAPLHFVLFYPLCLLLLYSCIPYKTPWCALSILHAFAIPAGIGFAGPIFSRAHSFALIATAAFAVAAVSRLEACSMTLTRYATDPRNPWAYAHTQRDYLRLTTRFRNFYQACGRHPTFLVLTDHVDHWPLPWYTYETDRVDYMDFRGWEHEPDKDNTIRRHLAAEPDFILCRLDDTSTLPNHQRYHWEDITLRPNVILRLGTHRAALSLLVHHP